eukprot:5759491-Prorocentrum_lima.AAC.1
MRLCQITRHYAVEVLLLRQAAAADDDERGKPIPREMPSNARASSSTEVGESAAELHTAMNTAVPLMMR